jgi:predicted RNase H-like nuclease (RuvC/YqgF family)
MKENKIISRSIRMTETVSDFVQRQVGAGFNQKFENTVHRFMWEESELDRRIEGKKKLLEELSDRIGKLQRTIKGAEDLHWMLESIKASIRELNDKCNSQE